MNPAEIATDPCPPLEDLAALLDAALDERERARVVAHLARCAQCYAVVTGAARFQIDEGEEDAVAEVVPFRRRVAAFVPFGRRMAASSGKWAAGAAAAVLAVAIGVVGYRSLGSDPRIGVAELVETTTGRPGMERHVWSWKTYRGLGDDEQSDYVAELDEYSRSSFLAGAWLVDRRISLDAGDLQGALEYSRRLSQVLRRQTGGEAAAPVFLADLERGRELEEAATEGAREALLAGLRKDAAEREQLVEETSLSPTFLTLGKWTEAGHLAAATRTADFFDRRDHRRFLDYFLDREGELLEDSHPEVAAALQEIRRAWDRTEGKPDFDALERGFAAILQTYDR